MFRTYRQTALPLESRLEKGLELWASVEQIIFLPCYYIAVARLADEGGLRQMLMNSDVMAYRLGDGRTYTSDCDLGLDAERGNRDRIVYPARDY